jgi:SAM-dependent methyltransferase
MQENLYYRYFKCSDSSTFCTKRKTDGAISLSRERLNPSLKNPDYLVLRHRAHLFSKWIEELDGDEFNVIDIGGRIQPYRSLLGKRQKKYVAIDPQATGLVDAIAVGEHLPFKDEMFELAFCTQTLGYVDNPSWVVAEIHRVLRPGATFILSVPAFFPKHHDERWRFLPEGLETLLSCFSRSTVCPEGNSIAGICRTANVCLNLYFKNRLFRKIISTTAIPAINLCGIYLDHFSGGNDRLTANFSAIATK